MSLTPREEIVHAILTGEPYQPRTLEYIAKAFGVSKQMINEVEHRALKKMKKLLPDPLLWEEFYVHLK